jgi:thioredoxin reductase (NADPH)
LKQELDVLIIGAGPIGLNCGIEAKKANLNYLIIEKGCLVNSLFNYPLGMTFFSTSEKLEIGAVPFVSHLIKPNRAEALEYYRKVAAANELNINLYETVLSAKRQKKLFNILTSKSEYISKAIIIATGFFDFPQLMNIEGENLSKVRHYYKEPHPYTGQKIAVIGASNSAVDVALECYRKGAEVTMIVRGPQIKSSVKYWIRPDIENRIKEGEIKAYFNSNVINISEKYLMVDTPDGIIKLDNDFLLAMTGYQPDFSFLEKMGIDLMDNESKTPVINHETMETNQSGIYLAGVICGGMETRKWFIENSRVHSEIIINQLKKNIDN